jgi:hypothetical protein
VRPPNLLLVLVLVLVIVIVLVLRARCTASIATRLASAPLVLAASMVGLQLLLCPFSVAQVRTAHIAAITATGVERHAVYVVMVDLNTASSAIVISNSRVEDCAAFLFAHQMPVLVVNTTVLRCNNRAMDIIRSMSFTVSSSSFRGNRVEVLGLTYLRTDPTVRPDIVVYPGCQLVCLSFIFLSLNSLFVSISPR